MRYLSLGVLFSLATLLSLAVACSTTPSRIRRHQAEFETYSPEVKAKIRAGKVGAGFTREQVSIAMGGPDRTRTRKTSDGEQEVWVYGIGVPRSNMPVGFVIGGGIFGGPAVPDEQHIGDDELFRVIFQNGAVVRTESRQDVLP